MSAAQGRIGIAIAWRESWLETLCRKCPYLWHNVVSAVASVAAVVTGSTCGVAIGRWCCFCSYGSRQQQARVCDPLCDTVGGGRDKRRTCHGLGQQAVVTYRDGMIVRAARVLVVGAVRWCECLGIWTARVFVSWVSSGYNLCLRWRLSSGVVSYASMSQETRQIIARMLVGVSGAFFLICPYL